MTAGSAKRRSAGTPVPVADVTSGLASAFGALALALACAYLTTPVVRPWLAADSGLVAWFTRVAWIAALVVGVWASRRSLPGFHFHRVIPALALWGLADAARYGLPVFDATAPTLGGVPLSSLAGLVNGAGHWAAGAGLSPGLGIAAIAIVAFGGYAARQRARVWAAGRVMATEPRVVDYLVLSVVSLAAAPAIGLLGTGEAIAFAARLATMTAATVLVVAGLAAGDHRRTVVGWRGRIRPWLDGRPAA